MQLEKETAYRIMGSMRDIVPLDELCKVITILSYNIICERDTSHHFKMSGKDLSELKKIADPERIEEAKKWLEKNTDDELRDLSFYSTGYACEMGSRFSDSSSPSLAELAISLLKIEQGDRVFDLGSGEGAFLVDVHKYCESKGIELREMQGLDINPERVYLSQMNLNINNAYKAAIVCKDFIDGTGTFYNKGYAFPTFGMKTPDYKRVKSLISDYVFNGRNSYEWVFVDRLLKDLSGCARRAVAIVPSRSMFNNADKEYRDTLIKAGLIETIVDLPAGALNFTSIKASLIVFSDGNKSVKVVDATNVGTGVVGKFSKFALPVDEILSLINDSKPILNSGLLSAHSLSASSLLAAKGQSFVGTPLGELAKVFTGSQYTVKNFESMFKDGGTGYRILTSSDIKDGAVEWDKLQSIDYKENKFDKYAVQKNDVVITAKSSKVKIAVVDIEPKEKILVTGGMIVVRPNTEKLNPTFLKIFLDSSKGQIALKMIQRGTIIITINAKDLATVLIPDETVDNQNAIAKRYNSKLSTYLALKEQLIKLEDQLHDFSVDDIEKD